MFAAIQHCSCVITLVTVMHLSVFVCYVSVRTLYFSPAWLYCVLSKSKLYFVFFLIFCFCVLRVLLSPALSHLTIYSKVSFSAGLQGNDTEDYCLDQ